MRRSRELWNMSFNFKVSSRMPKYYNIFTYILKTWLKSLQGFDDPVAENVPPTLPPSSHKKFLFLMNFLDILNSLSLNFKVYIIWEMKFSYYTFYVHVMSLHLHVKECILQTRCLCCMRKHYMKLKHKQDCLSRI